MAQTAILLLKIYSVSSDILYLKAKKSSRASDKNFILSSLVCVNPRLNTKDNLILFQFGTKIVS